MSDAPNSSEGLVEDPWYKVGLAFQGVAIGFACGYIYAGGLA